MVIDIPRALLISEPWTTMSIGGVTNTKPMVVSLKEEESQATQLAQQLNAAPDGANTFRVVDDIGPCYEFQGVAVVKNDTLSVQIEGDLKFLR